MDDKPQKKRGRPKKAKSTENSSLSGNSVKFKVNSQEEFDKLDALFKDAINSVILERSPKFKNEQETIDAITSVCSEFLKSFIIMGYDLEDKSIGPIFYARSDMEADALSHYMQQYFIQSVKDLR